MNMFYLQVFLDVPWQYSVISPHISSCTFLAKFILSYIVFVSNMFLIIFLLNYCKYIENILIFLYLF